MKRVQSTPRATAHDTTPRNNGASIIITGAMIELIVLVCLFAVIAGGVAAMLVR